MEEAGSEIRPIRPFFVQSDLSLENGRFRQKPKLGFLTQSKKSFFDLEFRLADPVEKLDFFEWICQSKNSVEKVYTCFLNPSHRSSNRKTHTHTRYHTAVSYNTADATLAITAVASRRKPAWRTLSSACQHHVSHDGSSARY